MKSEKRQLGLIILMVCIMFSLIAYTGLNLALIKEPLSQICQGDISFTEFVDSVKENYTSDELYRKDFFINLNGLFGRVTGRRLYNDVVLTTNGMLSALPGHPDTAPLEKGIVDLSCFLSAQNIPFMYVQAPYKTDLTNTMFPVGLPSFANESTDSLLQNLNNNEIDTLDLRPVLSQTPDMVEKYFYATDHHWNYTGAFIAFEEILRHIDLKLQEKDLNFDNVSIEHWNSNTLENWFLGSRGKRVGSWFAGVDDLVYYTPDFETAISCTIPKHRKIYKGSFTNAIVREQYIHEKDYFGDNAYCLYIGGSYPIVELKNMNAPTDLEILCIGDSFARPVYSYLSTVFQSVNAVDPRYLTECSVAEYITWTSPDLVITLLNPSVFTHEAFSDFGTEEYPFSGSLQFTEEINDINILVKANDSKNNYETIDLQNNRTYRLYFEDITFGKSTEPIGAVVALYNKTTKKVVCSKVFDIEYSRKNDTFAWMFKTPDIADEQYSLLFYAGLSGQTQGIEALYHNISLLSYKDATETTNFAE